MIDEKVLIERLEEEVFSAELHDYGWEGQTLHNLLVLGNVQVIAEELASEHNNDDICLKCKYELERIDQEPCVNCMHLYFDKFKPKGE